MTALRPHVPTLLVAAAAGLVTNQLGAGAAPAILVMLAVAVFAELARLHPPPDPTPPALEAPARPRGDLHPLSKREAEVSRLVADGLSNKEIAKRIWRSDRVVDTHVQNSFNKLGFHNRSELTRWVVEHDLAEHPDDRATKSVSRD